VYELDEDKETSKKLQLAANLNIGACCLKTKDYRDVIEACNKALEIDTKNEKGLFRMAQAYFGLGEFNEAIFYFNRVLEVNPDNKEAISHIALSRRKLQEYHEKEKAMYTKMFSK
jgi:FK506-binding protein 4/5